MDPYRHIQDSLRKRKMAKSFAEKSPSFLPFLEQVSWGSEYRTAHNHDAS